MKSGEDVVGAERVLGLKKKYSNPPEWGNNVRIYYPPRSEEESRELEASIKELLVNVNPKKDVLDWRGSQNGHFSNERWCLFFSGGVRSSTCTDHVEGFAKYDIDFAVGYYTQVLGLGVLPSQVSFVGELGPYCKSLDQRRYGAGSLNTFWRSMENVQLAPKGKKTYWAVSQAAPMRRVEVIGNLLFSDDSTRQDRSSAKQYISGSSYASGGYAADIKVTQGGQFDQAVWYNDQNPSVKRPSGETLMGSQQQFFFRNCSFAQKSSLQHITNAPLTTIEAGDTAHHPDPTKVLPISKCAWSLVQVGCANSKATTTEKNAGSMEYLSYSLDDTPAYTIAEKPYIIERWDEDQYQKFSLMVPYVKSSETKGVSFADSFTAPIPATEIPFDYVFYADAEVLGSDAASKIQAELDQGYHIVFGPGIFELTGTLFVSTPDQVLLGIGLATLKPPSDGSPCIRVAPKIDGVRIAGLTLQASQLDSLDILPGSTLLEWGTWQPPAEKSVSTNPGILSDIFCRVGGPDVERKLVGCDTMIRINSHHVTGDNLWLWRADHSALEMNEKPAATEAFHLVKAGEFPAHTCLEVFGDSVTMYGLACEHSIRDITIWHGNHGKCYFYQCELPYDVAQSSFHGHAGYVLDSSVSTHFAAGLGIYSFFRDFQVIVKSAIKAPTQLTTKRITIFQNAFTRFLNKGGYPGILNVINHQGGPSYASDTHDGSNDGIFPRIYLWPK